MRRTHVPTVLVPSSFTLLHQHTSAHRESPGVDSFRPVAPPGEWSTCVRVCRISSSCRTRMSSQIGPLWCACWIDLITSTDADVNKSPQETVRKDLGTTAPSALASLSLCANRSADLTVRWSCSLGNSFVDRLVRRRSTLTSLTLRTISPTSLGIIRVGGVLNILDDPTRQPYLFLFPSLHPLLPRC